MDFIKDQNPTALYEVGLKAGDLLPDYIKKASIPQPEDVTNLHDVAFADRVNRLHPIHTKAATYMSAVYLAGKGMQDTAIFSRVKAAGEVYGITDDIEAAIKLLPAPTSKEASAAEEEYALKFKMEDSDTWQAYAIGSYIDVTKSAVAVLRDWNDEHIPTDWLYAAARNIVKKAKELNVNRDDIPITLWEIGEPRVLDFKAAEEYALTRQDHGVADVAPYIDAVKKAATGESTAEDAISTWMLLDAQNGLTHKRLIAPQAAFYSGAKVAHIENLANSNVFIADVLVPREALCATLKNDGACIKKAFRAEQAAQIIDLVDSVHAGTKSAAVASKEIANWPKHRQKELLSLLLEEA